MAGKGKPATERRVRSSPRHQRGKRTGVEVKLSQENKSGELENEDDYFAMASSPRLRSSAASVSSALDQKENRKVHNLRFSLESSNSAKESASSGSSTRKTKVAQKVRQTRQRITGRTSDVSSVATAAASRLSDTQEEGVEEIETARHAQHEVDEEIVAATAATPEPTDNFPEPASPVAEPDDDDDDDDILPPRPPSPQSDSDLDMPIPSDTQESDLPVTQFGDAEEDVDDDDKEGNGFTMTADTDAPDTPVTTESEIAERKEKERKMKLKQEKQKKKKRKSSATENETATKTKRRNNKAKTKGYFPAEGIQTGPREYDELTIIEPDNDNEGLRRSRRARTKPLQFWKNEKYQYGPNQFDEDNYVGVRNMPVPVKIVKAGPTPRKARTTVIPTSNDNRTKSKKDAGPAPVKAFDSTQLRNSRYTYVDGEEAELYDISTEDLQQLKAVSYHDQLVDRKLPAKGRRKEEGKVSGRACQTFHVDGTGPFPGYIAGKLSLPPKGIKDAESTSACTQIFTIVDGQPGAIEVAYWADEDEEESGKEFSADPNSAQRFLLSPRDMLRVPPGNVYRLCNHSKTHEAYITWVIIRAVEDGSLE